LKQNPIKLISYENKSYNNIQKIIKNEKNKKIKRKETQKEEKK